MVESTSESINESINAPSNDRTAERSLELDRFRAWHASGDVTIRDAIITDAQGLAIGLARRFRDRGAELDDLIQVARLGLMNAVDRFDPERGAPFVSFATPTILGELRRHFRTIWSVRVPRSLQEASLRLAPALTDLQQELRRSPTVDELAVRLGCSPEAVLEAMEASNAFRASSLDTPVGRDAGGSSGHPADQLASSEAEEAFAQVDARRTVDRLLPLLSARSRRIVELRFYDRRSQVEIAEIVGISQMHVSRLLRQALDQMSAALQSDQAPAD